MPTNNPRINVTFEPGLCNQISSLASRENKSASRVIQELVIEALEKREDLYLSNIAEARDTKNQKTVSHKNAWR